MSAYKLLQIDLHKHQNNQAVINTRFMAKKEDVLAVRDLYEHVATIDAESLNEVFEIGNMGPEENITRLKPMYSASVGDIVVAPNGKEYLIASIGFTKL